MAHNQENFTVSWLAQEAQDIYQYAKQTYASTKGMRIFLCGAESFVRKMKKQCFLAGANMKVSALIHFCPVHSL